MRRLSYITLYQSKHSMEPCTLSIELLFYLLAEWDLSIPFFTSTKFTGLSSSTMLGCLKVSTRIVHTSSDFEVYSSLTSEWTFEFSDLGIQVMWYSSNLPNSSFTFAKYEIKVALFTCLTTNCESLYICNFLTPIEHAILDPKIKAS